MSFRAAVEADGTVRGDRRGQRRLQRAPDGGGGLRAETSGLGHHLHRRPGPSTPTSSSEGMRTWQRRLGCRPAPGAAPHGARRDLPDRRALRRRQRRHRVHHPGHGPLVARGDRRPARRAAGGCGGHRPASGPSSPPTPGGPDPARRGRPSEAQQHPGVAERVRLDPFQVQELGDTLVVRAQQLLVDRRAAPARRRSREAERAEEPGLEGEHEDPAPRPAPGPRRSGRRRSGGRSCRPRQAGSTATVRISARSSHITCSAPQPTTVPSAADRHPELLHVLVEGDGGLAQQPPVVGVGVDQPPDAAHVAGAGPPDDDLRRVRSRLPARPRTARPPPRLDQRQRPRRRTGSRPGPAPSAWPRCTCRHFTRPGMPPAEIPAISGTWPIASRRAR